MKIQKKRDVCAVVHQAVVGLGNWCWWFWPVGPCPRYKCPHSKDLDELAFLLVSVLIIMCGERAQEFSLALCWAVCSPVQLSKNLVLTRDWWEGVNSWHSHGFAYSPGLELAHSAWITSIYPHLIWPCTTGSCNLYILSIATTAFLQWEIRALKLN